MSSSGPIDVTGIGNAIVDVLAHADDAFLERQGLVKGTMALIDEARTHELYDQMGQGVEVSGGSCANTLAGIAALGGRAAFVGKVCDDQLGEVFSHDIRAVGVSYETAPITGGASTARCLILVTPDAQRTMNTYLGACRDLSPDDIDDELVRRSQVTYMEGYLWDPPGAKEAFLKASRIAEQAGNKTSLSLSDPFCVERHRKEFRNLVDEHVDILFANEVEICSLYEVERFEDAVAAVRGRCDVTVLTRSERGSVILVGDETHEVPAEKVARVVDTTGAGDLYAAGFLYGYTRGKHPAECGRLGAVCAAEIVSHFGARPEANLAELAAGKLA
ncbi:MAG: adenosine kinase [Myxococcales bacterium]|jgi:sugar/nucleoside kinase (ribokinase family)